jgi:hypothetical protein
VEKVAFLNVGSDPFTNDFNGVAEAFTVRF